MHRNPKWNVFLASVEIVTIQEEIPQGPKMKSIEIVYSKGQSNQQFTSPVASKGLVIQPEDPFPQLTEDHNEQFCDDIHGPELNKRRNAVCNELEKETNRVKINGFRMSLHDMRVDLGELTKRSKIRESVLENSDLQTEGETNISYPLMFIYYFFHCGLTYYPF